MVAEIWTASVGDAGGKLKLSCPLNCVPPFTGDITVLAVPKAVFVVASYALPVA